jgi:hypothetical protein
MCVARLNTCTAVVGCTVVAAVSWSVSSKQHALSCRLQQLDITHAIRISERGDLERSAAEVQVRDVASHHCHLWEWQFEGHAFAAQDTSQGRGSQDRWVSGRHTNKYYYAKTSAPYRHVAIPVDCRGAGNAVGHRSKQLEGWARTAPPKCPPQPLTDLI